MVEESREMLNSIAEIYRVKEVDTFFDNYNSRRHSLLARPESLDVIMRRGKPPPRQKGDMIAKFRQAVRLIIQTRMATTLSAKQKRTKTAVSTQRPEEDANKAKNFGFRLSDYRAKAAALSMSPDVKRIFIDFRKEQRTEAQLNTLQHYISRYKGFAKYTSKVQYELCKVLELEAFEKDRIILKQGHKPYSFYFLVSGTCEAYRIEQDRLGRPHKRVLSLLHTGDLFGDIALIKNIMRTASIACVEDCELLRVDKDDLDVVLQLIRHQEALDKLHFLEGTPIADTLSRAEFTALNDCGTIREMTKNAVVFSEGDTSDSVFFIRKGTVRIVRTALIWKQKLSNGRVLLMPATESTMNQVDYARGDTVYSELLTAETLGVGQYFGEDELLAYIRMQELVGDQGVEDLPNHSQRKYTVLANESCEFIEYSRVDFLKRVGNDTLELMRTANTLRPLAVDLTVAYLQQRGWTSVKKKVIQGVLDAKRAERERIKKGWL
ncbi:hypothetical protein RI367_003944 [Sorochytrium milnesiophthora]